MVYPSQALDTERQRLSHLDDRVREGFSSLFGSDALQQMREQDRRLFERPVRHQHRSLPWHEHTVSCDSERERVRCSGIDLILSVSQLPDQLWYRAAHRKCLKNTVCVGRAHSRDLFQELADFNVGDIPWRYAVSKVPLEIFIRADPLLSFPPLIPIGSIPHVAQAREEHLKKPRPNLSLVRYADSLQRFVDDCGHLLAMRLVLLVAIAAGLKEIFRIVSNGRVELGIEDANPLDQHEIDRVCFTLQERKSKRECIHIELCVSRRVKLWLDPINEMTHERVNKLLS